MLGSALETLLTVMVSAFAEEAEQTGKSPASKGKIRPLLDWSLADLLRVPKAAGWLPSGLDLSAKWSRRKARVGDYAEVVRDVRNLAHPARYVADHRGKRVTGTFSSNLRSCWLVAIGWRRATTNP